MSIELAAALATERKSNGTLRRERDYWRSRAAQLGDANAQENIIGRDELSLAREALSKANALNARLRKQVSNLANKEIVSRLTKADLYQTIEELTNASKES